MMKILTSVFVFLWHDRRMNPWPWPSALQQTRFKCQIQFYNTVTQDRLCLKSILGQWQTIPLQFHLSTWEVSCSVDVKSKPGTCLSTLCKPTVMQLTMCSLTCWWTCMLHLLKQKYLFNHACFRQNFPELI